MRIDASQMERAKADVGQRPAVYASMIRGSDTLKAEIEGLARVVCDELEIPSVGRRFRVIAGAVAAAVHLGYAIRETEHEEG